MKTTFFTKVSRAVGEEEKKLNQVLRQSEVKRVGEVLRHWPFWDKKMITSSFKTIMGELGE